VLSIVIVSGWTLYNSENEARKLLKVDLYWTPLKPGEDENVRYAKIKRRMVLFYRIICASALCSPRFGHLTSHVHEDGSKLAVLQQALPPSGNQARHPRRLRQFGKSAL
jgi:hypothetical protein